MGGGCAAPAMPELETRCLLASPYLRRVVLLAVLCAAGVCCMAAWMIGGV